MNTRSNMIRINIAAFAVLYAVSVYRQLSLRFLAHDPVRTYIVYAAYVALLGLWIGFVALHISQKSMRRYLLAEGIIMLFAMTLRFVQDTFLYHSVSMMRESGLIVGATVLPAALMGLYAALGLGQPDDYRISGWWWLLMVPAGILTALLVTDNREHFFFFTDRAERQPNLIFHPYIGMYVISFCVLFIGVLKVWIIYRRNRFAMSPLLKDILPFVQPVLLAAFLSPYILNAMMKDTPEVVEFFAKFYAIEIVTWEIYIYFGLVPVNTSYEQIFENSGIPMQLYDSAGRKILDSGQIPDLSADMYARLKSGDAVQFEGGELHLYTLGTADFVWEKDISRLHTIIQKLEQTASELEGESVLLDEEVRAKSERAKTDAKNKIYDQLTDETAYQLDLMKKVISRMQRGGSDPKGFRQLTILGTYVKRRCNLRLIERETGVITDEDLKICFQDMAGQLERQEVRVAFFWNTPSEFSPDFSLFVFDALEKLLEKNLFFMTDLDIEKQSDGILYTVRGENPAGGAGMRLQTPEGVTYSCEKAEDGSIRVRIRKKADTL